MTDLYVGGFHVKNRYKTLEDAITHARRGDTIILDKSVTLGGIKVPVDVTIDGNYKTITISEGVAGFILSQNFSLKNVFIRIPVKTNVISVDENSKSSRFQVLLDSVEFLYHKKGDPRDYYTFLNLTQNQNLSLTNVVIPYVSTVVNHLKIEGSVIGDIFGRESAFECHQPASIKITNLSNLYLNLYHDSELNNVSTHGGVFIDSQDNVKISMHDFIVDGLQLDEKEFRKSFKDKALFKNEWVALHVRNGSIMIDGFILGHLPVAYDLRGLVVDSSTLTLKNDEPLLSHEAYHSKIESVSDSEWYLEDSSINNPEQIGKGDSDALQKMQSLIGLEQAKAQLNKFISTARINAEQSRRGIKQTASFANHMVFAGPAGTGKTTVANYLAQALADEGVLRDNKVVVVGSKDLVSKWVGDTKDKTHNVILSALGGVLFIDEAYSLLPRGENNHAQEAVDQIVEDAMLYKDDLIIILAGYEKDMRNFIDTANTGLNSRFQHWIEFTPYTFEELAQILILQMKNSGTKASQETIQYIVSQLYRIYQRDAGENGLDGNGRYIENLLRDLLDARNNRLAQSTIGTLTDDDLLTVTLEDAKNVLEKK